jgi:hypothetical protein
MQKMQCHKYLIAGTQLIRYGSLLTLASIPVDPGMQRQGYINLDAGDTAYLVLLKDEPDTSNVNVDGFVWVSPVP